MLVYSGGMNKFLGLALGVLDRLPLERMILKPPNSSKHLQELANILKSNAAPPRPEPAAEEEPARTFVHRAHRTHLHEAPAGISNKETVDYQNREIGKLLLRMERHYAQRMRINGRPCDCGAPKHLLDMEGMTEEVIPMVDNPEVYYRLLEWVKEVGPNSNEQAAKSGQYDSVYPVYSHQARDFRKEIIGSLDVDALFPRRAGDVIVEVEEPIPEALALPEPANTEALDNPAS